MPTLRIRVPRLHAGQLQLREIAERSKVTVAVLGRRWGKTFFGVNYAFDRMTRPVRPESSVAWIAPTYDHTRIAWDEFCRWYGPALIPGNEGSNKSEHWLRLRNGHRLYFRSADNPTSIRGRGYGLALVDEGAFIARQAFDNEIVPTLMDTDGDLVLFTTPAGRRGFVFDEYQRSVHNEAGYGHLQRASTDNPNPKIAEWVARRKGKMTTTAYQQEILAQFIEDSMSLFRNAQGVVGGALSDPVPGKRYYAGVDLAKVHDWTVVLVIDLDASPWQVVHFARFHELSWRSQAKKVASICKRYNGSRACVDATSVGEAVIEMMEAEGLSVDGFTFTTQSRPELLDNLSVHYENRTVRIPKELDDGVLGDEVRSFMTEVDANGKVRYVASGEFDDCVMALALACYGAPQHPTPRLSMGLAEVAGADGDPEAAIEDGRGDTVLEAEY